MHTYDFCNMIEVQKLCLYGVCNNVQLLMKPLTMLKSVFKKLLCD